MNKKLHCKEKRGRIYVFIVLCCLLSTSTISYARGIRKITQTIEQQVQQKKVTINIKNSSAEVILLEIKKQSGISFIFKSDVDSKALNNLSLNVTNQTVESALNTLFASTNVTYTLSDGLITIIKKQAKQENKRILISGKVVDVNKEPIPGASVLIKGTQTGAISDGAGKFTFFARENDVLEVTFVGKKTVLYSKLSSEAKEIVITMLNDEIGIDDVVVTGYQNVGRQDMVGSYTQIKADDIKIAGATSITDMLQGQVAGMIVTNQSSRVGSSSKIKIRGTTTLGNTDPIFVVDGIIQPDPIKMNATSGIIDDMKNIIGDQVSWLNPDDINTITVLKDASATAIYGSRASNGVIVITTKKPKYGDRLSISYSGTLTVAPRPNYNQFNYMNSQERIIFSEEAFNAGIRYQQTPIQDMNTYDGLYYKYLSGQISEKTFSNRKAQLETMNTDWFDLLTRTAVSHNHNISVAGASNKATYRVSAGYNKQNGIERGNSKDRFTANTNVDFQLHEKVKLSFGINASIDKTTGFAGGVNPLRYATETSRAIPAFEEDGSYAYYNLDHYYWYNQEKGYSKYNILNEIENSDSQVGNGRISANINFNWKIIKNLTYEFTAGYNYSQSNKESYMGEQTNYVAANYRGYDYNEIDPTSPWYRAALLPHGGVQFNSNANNQSYNIQNKLIFQKQFNADHRLNVMAGVEVNSSANKDAQNTVYGLVKDRGNILISPTSPNKFAPLGSSLSGFLLLENLYKGDIAFTDYTNNFVSLFATAAYSFKSRYVFNTNVRNDMSNRFGQDTNNRLDPTYSFGVAWRMSEEPWMENVKNIFSDINFKITYGIQGNADLTKSPDLILKQGGIMSPYEGYGSSIVSIPNSNLTWERTKNWNFSLDLQLFSKVNLIVDGYIRKSNAIIQREAPYYVGRETVDMNGGVLHNKGLEATLSFNPVNTRNFGFNFSVNASKNWNKGGETFYKASSYDDYLTGISTSILKEGYPINGFWSFDYAGLNPENGYPMFNKLDVDPKIASEDQSAALVYSGVNEHYFTGGINLSFRYKRVTLSSSFSLLLGQHKRLPSPYNSLVNGISLPTAEVNIDKDLNNRWKQPGDEKYTDIPALIYGNPNISLPFWDGASGNLISQIYAESSALVVNASFFRCNNLNLSYRFTPELAKKFGLNNLSIAGSVSNLFVVASKKFGGFDPELNNSVKPQGYSLTLSVGF